MSISSDIRSSADTAVNQGKQVLGQAQRQLTNVGGAVNLGALSTAAEPYLARLREYSTLVTDTVTERVLKPVQSLTGIGGQPSPPPVRKPAPKPRPAAAKSPRKPATTKPAKRPGR